MPDYAPTHLHLTHTEQLLTLVSFKNSIVFYLNQVSQLEEMEKKKAYISAWDVRVCDRNFSCHTQCYLCKPDTAIFQQGEHNIFLTCKYVSDFSVWGVV